MTSKFNFNELEKTGKLNLADGRKSDVKSFSRVPKKAIQFIAIESHVLS